MPDGHYSVHGFLNRHPADQTGFSGSDPDLFRRGPVADRPVLDARLGPIFRLRGDGPSRADCLPL